MSDLRCALRTLSRQPSYTLTAIATLAGAAAYLAPVAFAAACRRKRRVSRLEPLAVRRME